MNKCPTEVGWYWFKEEADGKWKAVEVGNSGYSDTPGLVVDIPNRDGYLWVKKSWPQQWGPKIEEPK